MALNRFPSLKTCIAAFGTEKGTALRSAFDVANQHYWHTNRIMSFLDQADAILETHGLESIQVGHNQRSPSIAYCNTGDTYGTTLLLLDDDRWAIGSWGDIVERGHYD